MSESTVSDSEEIACPHCGAIERDLNDYEWMGTQDTIATHCDKCGGKYNLCREQSVIYRAFPVPS